MWWILGYFFLENWMTFNAFRKSERSRSASSDITFVLLRCKDQDRLDCSMFFSLSLTFVACEWPWARGLCFKPVEGRVQQHGRALVGALLLAHPRQDHGQAVQDTGQITNHPALSRPNHGPGEIEPASVVPVNRIISAVVPTTDHLARDVVVPMAFQLVQLVTCREGHTLAVATAHWKEERRRPNLNLANWIVLRTIYLGGVWLGIFNIRKEKRFLSLLLF